MPLCSDWLTTLPLRSDWLAASGTFDWSTPVKATWTSSLRHQYTYFIVAYVFIYACSTPNIDVHKCGVDGDLVVTLSGGIEG